MDSSVNNFLPESLFFTARPRPFPSAAEVSTAAVASSSSPAASSASRYYSARIQYLTERMTKLDMSEVDAAIEASKDHWTQVEAWETESGTQGAGTSQTEMGSAELYEDNLAFFRRLKTEEDPSGEFFEDSSEWEYVLGEKIAEGGQAAIYPVLGCKYADGMEYTFGSPMVMKVFKAGISLVDLRKQWPLALLHKLDSEYSGYSKEKLGYHCNSIYYGCLLADGRFGFVMERRWGDLRKLMDLRMQEYGNLGPPFVKADGNYDDRCMLQIMLEIAMGVNGLHKEGTLHRDLKASNILIMCGHFDRVENTGNYLGNYLGNYFSCLVADFECSIGVVGTGYWRAPEILEGVKNRTWSTTPNIFTAKSDVYSYGMICYEILTGHVPFEGIEDIGKINIANVLEGKRPSLPRYLKPWMKELLCKCWHIDPLERPSFEEIVDFLILQVIMLLY